MDAAEGRWSGWEPWNWSCRHDPSALRAFRRQRLPMFSVSSPHVLPQPVHPFADRTVPRGMTSFSRDRPSVDALIRDADSAHRHVLAQGTDAIVLDGLGKTYSDGTEAVRGISLRV